MSKGQRRFNEIFYAAGSLLVMISVALLDCKNYIKIFVILLIALLYVCSHFWHWSMEKWVVAVLLCVSCINVYCDWTIYIPYRTVFSGSANKQVGFSTSQLCYVYNQGNADALLCTMLRERSVSVYGNCEIYKRYFELYSGEILDYNYEENVDFLMEKRELFLDMGRMSMSSISNCFEEEEIDMLRELRENRKEPYQLYLSTNSHQIVDMGELIIAIDSFHDIYVMTKQEWKELKNE